MCLTLCDLIDSSPPGSSVHGVLQARILEQVAISFSSFRDHFDTNIVMLCFFWLIFASFISSFSLFCLIILDLFNTSLMSPLNILLYFLYTIFAHLLKLNCRHCDSVSLSPSNHLISFNTQPILKDPQLFLR